MHERAWAGRKGFEHDGSPLESRNTHCGDPYLYKKTTPPTKRTMAYNKARTFDDSQKAGGWMMGAHGPSRAMPLTAGKC